METVEGIAIFGIIMNGRHGAFEMMDELLTTIFNHFI